MSSKARDDIIKLIGTLYVANVELGARIADLERQLAEKLPTSTEKNGTCSVRDEIQASGTSPRN